MPNINKVEIFDVGTWNGLDFTLADLQEIVRNFNALKNVLRVPLKIGHNDEQKLTDGQPAIGWVDDIYMEGTKLIGVFKDMPEIVANAVKKKLFNSVSSELALDAEHKGQQIGSVLTAVALLGADLPAVNTLADLNAYLSRDAKSIRFSNVHSFKYGDEPMPKEVEDLQKQIDELKTTNAKLLAEQKERELLAEAEKKVKFAEAVRAKRAEVTDFLTDAVKNEVITPAQQTSYLALFKVADDNEVVKIDIKDIESVVGTTRQDFKTTDKAKDKSGDAGEISAERFVFAEAQKLKVANNISFSDALELVALTHPVKHKEYLNQFMTTEGSAN